MTGEYKDKFAASNVKHYLYSINYLNIIGFISSVGGGDGMKVKGIEGA